MKRNILDVARVIRSKNSGPYELTLDILFKDRKWYDLFKNRKIVNEELISQLYKVKQDEILGIIWFEPVSAVKITIRRPCPSGSPGDTDIYGAQQHAPLLGIEFESEE
ncbi:MAG: DUF4387 domain-containing protein [Spirochaetes bacterium]|nr:DUF4387 domain-containing protein [Spirochaetota bacterium]